MAKILDLAGNFKSDAEGLRKAREEAIRIHPTDIIRDFPYWESSGSRGSPKRDSSIIVRSCKASQSPVYPIRDAFAVVEHPSCPSSSSSCPLPVG